MKPSPISVAMLVVSLFLAPAVLAQSPDSANQSAASPAASAAEVPRLIKFSGTLLDAQDLPMAGPVGVTFALHAQQTGGAALWMETQNVKADAHGNYTVLLGANSANGVPAELFASGEARWLEVQVERQAEQPRILLVSVPYALKAKDAETLGGRPASAFVTTETLAGTGNPAGAAAAPSSSTASTALPSSKMQTTPKKASSGPQPAAACANLTSDGTATANFISKFTTACNLQNSAMMETGGNVGIGTTTPLKAIDIEGNNAGMLIGGPGTHNLQLTGATSSGRLGQDLSGFFFASDTNGKGIKFLTNNGALNEWMRITSAGNVGIGTMTPAVKLDVAGNLNLPATTIGGTIGVISLGGTRFAHNFGPAGAGNTFIGLGAGNFGMTGVSNTAVGASALTANTTGFSNSAFGIDALASNTTSTDNSAFGDSALFSNTTSGDNSAFGFEALFSNTTGGSNSAVGSGALFANTTGFSNDAFGNQALQSNTTGFSNNAFGRNALQANTTGGPNSAFGDSALFANTIGGQNSAFGSSALAANVSGTNNSAFGNGALAANTIGGQNSAFGSGALAAATGGNNSAFGVQALAANVTASNNSAFGIQSLFSNTIGSKNSAFGNFALTSNMTGGQNSAFGFAALFSNTTGNHNAAFGSANVDFGANAALGANTTGNDNSAFGSSALAANVSGTGNSAIGSGALPALSSGNFNVAIGVNAGLNLTTGSSNIYIGSFGATSSESSTIRIGSGQVAAFMAGISGATSASGVAVLVNSNGQLGTTTSSRRFKDDIADMAGESDLLMKLRPVSFYYKPELDPTHTRQYGLVAEEVAQVSPELVVFDKDGAPQTVRYHFVNAMLLNEVQKQRKTNEEQQSTIARQQAEIQDLAARLAKLEALVSPVP